MDTRINSESFLLTSYQTFDPPESRPTGDQSAPPDLSNDLNGARQIAPTAPSTSTAGLGLTHWIRNQFCTVKAPSICTPNSSRVEIDAACQRGEAALAKYYLPSRAVGTSTRMPPVAWAPVDPKSLSRVPMESRNDVWVNLFFKAAGNNSYIEPARLAPLADALNELSTVGQIPAAEFVITYLAAFHKQSGDPGKLHGHVGTVFDGMACVESARILGETLIRMADSEFDGKQHLIALGISEHLSRFPENERSDLDRGVDIWKLRYRLPDLRQDAWNVTFTKLFALEAPSVHDIALYGNAIALLPAIGQQRHEAADRLATCVLKRINTFEDAEEKAEFVQNVLIAMGAKTELTP